MKKLKKIKLNESLNSEELNQLYGGINRNTVPDCTCTYYDYPSVRNRNTASGCSCECIGGDDDCDGGC